jgi:hypothetical protein
LEVHLLVARADFILVRAPLGPAGASPRVEAARRKKRLERGGGRLRVDLEAVGFLTRGQSEDLEALDEALTRLAAEDPAKAELVKLRFFAGLTMPEIAQVLKISLATAERHLTYARTWLLPSSKTGTIPRILEEGWVQPCRNDIVDLHSSSFWSSSRSSRF